MLTSLEVKTSYSILGSLNKIEALVSRAKELGYSSLAITDTNNMLNIILNLLLVLRFYLMIKDLYYLLRIIMVIKI